MRDKYVSCAYARSDRCCHAASRTLNVRDANWTDGTSPPTLFVAASSHFLPKTTANVRAYFAELEEKHAPALADAHSTAIAHSQMTWARAVEAVSDGRRVTGEKTEGVVRKIEEATGLKLGQVFGGGKAVAKKVEVAVVQKVEEVAEAAKEKAEAVKAEVEPQVKEVEKAGVAVVAGGEPCKAPRIRSKDDCMPIIWLCITRYWLSSRDTRLECASVPNQ